MSRAILLFALAALIGCATVDATSPSGLTWQDATGRTVDVFGEPNAVPAAPLLYRDPNGLFWQIDPETVIVSPVANDEGPFFASADCSGPPLIVGPPPPRTTFTLSDGTIHARDDSAKFGTSMVCSVESASGGCGAVVQGMCLTAHDVVPEADAMPPTPLAVPVVDFVAPLRPVAP